MRWLLREASLLTALTALVVLLQPSWLPTMVGVWIVILSVLVCGAVLIEPISRVPMESTPVKEPSARRPGHIRQMRDIEQANDFLVAVDYQLFPFLKDAVRDIAEQRLLLHRNIVLEREPVRARQILGEPAWRFIQADAVPEKSTAWSAMDLDHLLLVTDALEKV